MKIINLDKQEAYHLQPDAKLEVERTNPFFNDYAEQTIPMDLPASDHNRRLLGFPDLFGGRNKMVTSDVSIQDGEFHAQCRQAVLSATRKGTIQTSFYLNDGSFYSRIQNVSLKDIFNTAADTITFASMNAVLAWCRGLRADNDTRFTIFPVLVTDDSGLSGGFNYKILNAYGKDSVIGSRTEVIAEVFFGDFTQTVDITGFDPDVDGTGCDFYNAVQRTEYVNQIPITIGPGYYISPFIRVNHVLSRIFAHFGYTLQENFFTQTAPFNKMVLLNNRIDTLVNLKLIVSDLLPDVSATEMLAVIRKKFNCEFSVDEGSRTVGIVFLKDVVASPPDADLTDRVTADPTVNYKSEKDFKRLKLTPAATLDGEAEDNYDNLAEMFKTAPTAIFDPVTGAFARIGYSGDYAVSVKIGEPSQPYDTGEGLETEEVEIPECIPEPRTLITTYSNEDGAVEHSYGQFLYVGGYKTVNSKMVIAGDDNQESTDGTYKLLPMLAFVSTASGHAEGTISPYDIRSSEAVTRAPGSQYPYQKLWNYALYYNGEDGIFERFYRQYDQLLRNSLMPVKVRLLLTQSEKQNLKAWAKVTIRGVAFLLGKLKFTLGGKTEPVESELLTSALYKDPATGIISQAKTISEMLPMMAAEYRWVGRQTEESVSESDYDNSGVDKDRTFQTVYPPLPSADYLNQRWGQQVSYTKKQTRHSTFFRSSRYAFTRTTVWLECVHV